MGSLKVSVITLAYNHEDYIRDSLEGILKQQTDFEFEVLIHDDASTDNTASIIRDYQARFPNIIKPVFQTENQYSKGIALGNTFLYPKAKGQYIALCEGDDYWTDSLKLQKQVDYMDNNPNCSLVFTNALIKWDDDSKPVKRFSELEDKDYSGFDILNNWIIPTASVVYRKEILTSDLYRRVISNKRFSAIGDTPLFLTCAHFGTLHALPDVTCVYRKHDGGFLVNADSERKIQLGDYRREIYKAFGRKFKRVSILSALPHYRIGLWHAKQEKNLRYFFKILGRIFSIYLLHPVICCTRIRQIIEEKS